MAEHVLELNVLLVGSGGHVCVACVRRVCWNMNVSFHTNGPHGNCS
jgi:hypothetical protein